MTPIPMPGLSLGRFIKRQLAQPVLPQRFPPVGIGAYFRDDISQATIAANTLVFATPVATAGPGFSFQSPAGRIEIVTGLGIDVNTPAGLAFVRFRFTVDGSPLQNYHAPPALLGTVNTPTEVFVELRGESLFEVQFTNTDVATAYVVTMRLRHWAFDPLAALPVAER